MVTKSPGHLAVNCARSEGWRGEGRLLGWMPAWPAWAGQHSAALDGDQNKVSLSWTLDGDSIEFQVS